MAIFQRFLFWIFKIKTSIFVRDCEKFYFVGVAPFYYYHPSNMLPVSIEDFNEICITKRRLNFKVSHFLNCSVYSLENHVSGGLIAVKYNDGRVFGNKTFWKLTDSKGL